MTCAAGQKLRLLFFLSVFVAFLLLVPQACRSVISLGRNPEGEDLKKIEALPNYRNGAFQNIDTVPVGLNAAPPQGSRHRGPRWLRMLKYFTGKPAITRPPGFMPVVITDLVKTTYQTPTVFWFGHSSALLKTAAGNVLFDPIFNEYAGPIKGLVPAFKGTDAYGIKDLPPIEALVISHDHYDHLDYLTVKKLKKKVKRVVVPVGVGSHFVKWGYPRSMITELNWNDSIAINPQLTVTATPAHHRSNRTFEQRKTLWASYVINTGGHKIYFSGDTGYSRHFKLIGDRYGPFDLALMECGQYNVRWSGSHMHPTQTVRAAQDLRAAMTLPIHWGKFAESDHPWNEPPNLLLARADSLQLPVTVPVIGQPYSIGQAPHRLDWWNF